MTMLRKEPQEDLRACYDFTEFLDLLDKKLESWSKLSETFIRVRSSRAASVETDRDTLVFERLLVYTRDMFREARSASIAPSGSWQVMLLHAEVLESLAGLITQAWLMEALDKLDSVGALNKNKVMSDAAAIAKMDDFTYSLHILAESAKLIGEIQTDDVAYGYSPDPKLQDFKDRLLALRSEIERQGRADLTTKKAVDDAVSEAMEYSIKRMSTSAKQLPKLSTAGTKTGTDLN